MKASILILFLLCFACEGRIKHETTEREQGQPEDVHKYQHSEHGSANEFMHQSSVKELIQRFESAERDAYQKPDKVLEYLGDLEGRSIMDIGAGSGYFSVKLARKGANVIAADVDNEFLKFIQKRIEENQLNTIKTRLLPFDSPNLKEDEVDMVLMVNTYHHIENRPEYFKKVLQGTKEDGELVIIDFFKTQSPVGPPPQHKVSIDTVVNELKEAGYTKFTINVELLPYQFIIRAG